MPTDPMFSPTSSNRSMPDAVVIPVLLYPDVPAAVAWLCAAFGFRERLRIATHRVQLHVGRGAIVVAQGPADAIGQRESTSIMIRVSNVDAHFEVAARAGATVLGRPVSQPYGERQYSAADIGGHAWTFSQSEGDAGLPVWISTRSEGAQSGARRPVGERLTMARRSSPSTNEAF